MALQVIHSFAIFDQNLRITTLQNETVETRQTAVRNVLHQGFNVLTSFVSGSYSRGTMIAPLSKADIDVFVVLNSEYFHKYNKTQTPQANLLDAIRRALLQTYTRTPDISRSGQAVTVRFTDFVVDVVPAFHRQGGGLLIPNSIASSWLSTDPAKHVQLFLEADRQHEGRLLPLIRRIKAWNRCHSAFFRSFHLEVLALEVLSGITISNAPSGVRFFFEKARNAIAGQNADPAGFGDDVGRYIDTQGKLYEARSRLEAAYETALRAEEFWMTGREEQSVTAWRSLLGEDFPAYG